MNKYNSYTDTSIPWNETRPSHWGERRGKALFCTKKERNIGNQETNILSLTLRGVIHNSKDNPIGLSPSDYSTYQIFEKDDLVFKLIDLNNISTSRVGIVPERGIMSSAYIRLIARQDLNIRYFYLQYYNLWLRNVYNGLGAGVRQTISADELLNMSVVIPPRAEQDQIVRFLDWKVSEINGLINKKKEKIKELNNLKDVIVYQKVLSKDSKTKKKDSGIDWIGEMPEEWQLRRIKFLFDLRDERNFEPLSDVNLLSLYSGLGVIQNKDIEYTTGNRARNADGYKKVKKDDIVVNIILCWMGAIGMSCYEGVTSPAYDVYKPRPNAYSRYYHYLFRTKPFSDECYKVGKGIMAMRWRVYSPQFRNITVPFPPYDEQIRIADELDERLKTIDELIKNAECQVKELRELRNTIISDVVTGKIDVRNITVPEYEHVDDIADDDSDDDEESEEIETEIGEEV